jgi:hypothetical protein
MISSIAFILVRILRIPCAVILKYGKSKVQGNSFHLHRMESVSNLRGDLRNVRVN